jgi:hypothetical protein
LATDVDNNGLGTVILAQHIFYTDIFVEVLVDIRERSDLAILGASAVQVDRGFLPTV